jgi:hypothetical protein
MGARTIFLSRLIGLFAILIALAIFLRKVDFIDTATALVRNGPVVLIFGIVALAAGLAMVLAHNVWSGGVTAVVVTLCGWLILLRGLTLLFLPADVLARILDFSNLDRWVYLYAAIPLILGLYLTVAGFTARHADDDMD